MNILFGIVLLLLFGFWAWALLNLSFSDFKKPNWKIAWLLIIVFLPFLGSALYFVLRKDLIKEKPATFKPKSSSHNF